MKEEGSWEAKLAVDASIIVWRTRIDGEASPRSRTSIRRPSRAVAEYLSVLDDAAFSAGQRRLSRR